MPVLRNSRHEKFALIVAKGKTGSEAYRPGVWGELLGKIKPGETSTLTVNLEPGRYTAFCPELRGEQMTFKVTEE